MTQMCKSMQLSVVLCIFNPNKDYLKRVLCSLRNQTLSLEHWELLVVDNNSNPPVDLNEELGAFPNARVIRESRQGLIFARLKGNNEARGDYVVTVDDDTVLDKDYLRNCLDIIKRSPDIGIFGGRSVAEFEVQPPEWIRPYHLILCIKDLGEREIIERLSAGELASEFPTFAPFLIAYNKKIFEQYFVPHFNSNPFSRGLGRKGESLISGEDNDIVFTLYKSGQSIGYFPQLKFTHLIPAKRLSLNYMARLIEQSNKSWVLVLDLHRINPWPPISRHTLTLRKLKSYIANRAWRSPKAYLQWKSNCGIFEGQAAVGSSVKPSPQP